MQLFVSYDHPVGAVALAVCIALASVCVLILVPPVER